MMAAKPGEEPGGVKGQLELFREYALGNFRDLLIAVAKDPAMLVWLDGRLNTNPQQPQENFAREIMELFTFGVDHVVEDDVKAAAKVFTGWNLRQTPGASGDPARHYEYFFDARPNRGTTRKPRPSRSTSTRTAAARSRERRAGRHRLHQRDLPASADRPAARAQALRVLRQRGDSRRRRPSSIASSGVYYATSFDMRAVMRAVLTSPEFWDPSSVFARYSWPVEFVVRAIKETGWEGFSVDSALTPLLNMGQQLFEPPDVNGWELGQGWFSTATTLARMNFAATLTTNQRVNLRNEARPFGQTPQSVMGFVMERLSPASLESRSVRHAHGLSARRHELDRLGRGAPGQGRRLMHLVMGSGYYQFV